METKFNVQEAMLCKLRKEKMPVTVFMTNGFQQRGIITSFDGYTVLLYNEDKQYLLYKHAISTIVPARPVSIDRNEDGQ